MKLTNNEIFTAYQAIEDMQHNEKIDTSSFPVKLSFSLISIMKGLDPFYRSILECRDNIIKEYGVETENGAFDIPEENRPIVQEKITELGLIEQEVPDKKIPFSLIGSLAMNIEIIGKLYSFISEDE